MFHEDRELITKLKGSNARFTALFDKHNDLDEKIAEIQKGNVYNDAEVDALKREKLRLKDEIYAFLQKREQSLIKLWRTTCSAILLYLFLFFIFI